MPGAVCASFCQTSVSPMGEPLIGLIPEGPTMDRESPHRSTRDRAAARKRAAAQLPHEEVWQLLPWLANGSLAGGELEGVLDHLKICGTCRDELRFLPELRFVVEQADPPDAGPAPRPEALLERIERWEAGRDSGRESPTMGSEPRLQDGWIHRSSERVREWLAGPWGPPLALGQTLLLLVFMGLSVPRWTGAGVESPPAGSFHTLSQEPAAEGGVSAPEGARLRLVFDQGLREHELRSLLHGLGGVIVAGPNTVGAYTVRLGDVVDDELHPELLRELRQNPAILLAEPVAGNGP